MQDASKSIVPPPAVLGRVLVLAGALAPCLAAGVQTPSTAGTPSGVTPRISAGTPSGVTLHTPVARQAPSGSDHDPEREAARLLQAVADGMEPTTALLLEHLELTRGESVAALLAEGRAPRASGAAPALSAERRAQLLAALRGVPGRAAELLAGSELSPRRRVSMALAALGVILHTGDATGLELAFRVSAPDPAVDRQGYGAVEERLAATVAALLERDPVARSRLDQIFTRLDVFSQKNLLHGVRRVPSVANMRFLTELLGRSPSVDGIALTQLALVAAEVDAPLDDICLARVRSYLTHREPDLRRAAAGCLGKLDDYDSVEALIGLLADEQEGVRKVAHGALGEITAMTFSLDAARWRAWFEREVLWWDEEAAGVLARLHGSDHVKVMAAINDLASRRLFRRELTPEVLMALHDEDPRVARMACSALLSLRASGVERDLIALLDSPDADLGDLAWRVLMDLTGRRHPPQREPWLDALGPR